jgi:hypothetical protein
VASYPPRHGDVQTTDIRVCYEKLHLPVPNIAMYLTRMTETKPPKALRKGDNYNLTRAARTDLDAKYGIHPTIVQVSKLLTDLPTRSPIWRRRSSSARRLTATTSAPTARASS